MVSLASNTVRDRFNPVFAVPMGQTPSFI
jgi:hypothetical protein